MSANLKDPNYMPPLGQAIPLGIQHVLAMFVSNVTPAIIVAGAAGFGFGSADMGQMIYMIQMSMFFAGIATLIQTVGIGPIGARLPIVQGTSFAFLPVMIPLVAGQGVAAMPILMGGVVAGGIFHLVLGGFIGRIRHWLPPLVTGLVVLMIGLSLVAVGIKYAAGGAAKFQMEAPDFGSLKNWSMALVVILVTLGLKFFTRGLLSVAAVLIGLIVGYAYAFTLGEVSFANVSKAADFVVPNLFHFGPLQFTTAAVVGLGRIGSSYPSSNIPRSHTAAYLSNSRIRMIAGVDKNSLVEQKSQCWLQEFADEKWQTIGSEPVEILPFKILTNGEPISEAYCEKVLVDAWALDVNNYTISITNKI